MRETNEMNIAEIKLGDIVNMWIAGEVFEGYVVSGFDEKNERPVVDLYSGNDSRWAYEDQILEITGHVGLEELVSLLDTPRARLGLPEDATTDQMIKAFRKQLKVSRATLVKATGLTLSVIWRSEQPGNTVSVEDNTKIWDALEGIEGAA